MLTTSGTIQCQLTRYGRQLLADNSAQFRITKYRFSDDEINYSDFDGTTIDAANTTILSTPILEADTVGGVPSQRYQLKTLVPNTLNIAHLDADIGFPFIDGDQAKRSMRTRARLILDADFWRGKTFTFNIRTYSGRDEQYLVRSNNRSFVGAGSNRVDSVPCTDPYESRQNQTQGNISVIVSVRPETQVFNTVTPDILKEFINSISQPEEGSSLATQFALISRYKDQIYAALRNLFFSGNQGTLNTATSIPGGGSPVLPTPIGSAAVDQFGELGLAYTYIEVRGSNTGKLFYIDTLLYSQARLIQLIRSSGTNITGFLETQT